MQRLPMLGILLHQEQIETQRGKESPNRGEYVRRRCARDDAFKTLCRLRGRVTAAIRAKGAKKAARTVEMLGCTIREFRAHLERLFQPGMTWENYGKYGWHIDHIKPCAAFNLLDPDEQRACFHYTNMQPLWAAENFKKKDTYSEA